MDQLYVSRSGEGTFTWAVFVASNWCDDRRVVAKIAKTYEDEDNNSTGLFVSGLFVYRVCGDAAMRVHFVVPRPRDNSVEMNQTVDIQNNMPEFWSDWLVVQACDCDLYAFRSHEVESIKHVVSSNAISKRMRFSDDRDVGRWDGTGCARMAELAGASVRASALFFACVDVCASVLVAYATVSASLDAHAAVARPGSGLRALVGDIKPQNIGVVRGECELVVHLPGGAARRVQSSASAVFVDLGFMRYIEFGGLGAMHKFINRHGKRRVGVARWCSIAMCDGVPDDYAHPEIVRLTEDYGSMWYLCASTWLMDVVVGRCMRSLVSGGINEMYALAERGAVGGSDWYAMCEQHTGISARFLGIYDAWYMPCARTIDIHALGITLLTTIAPWTESVISKLCSHNRTDKDAEPIAEAKRRIAFYCALNIIVETQSAHKLEARELAMHTHASSMQAFVPIALAWLYVIEAQTPLSDRAVARAAGDSIMDAPDVFKADVARHALAYTSFGAQIKQVHDRLCNGVRQFERETATPISVSDLAIAIKSLGIMDMITPVASVARESCATDVMLARAIGILTNRQAAGPPTRSLHYHPGVPLHVPSADEFRSGLDKTSLDIVRLLSENTPSVTPVSQSSVDTDDYDG